MHLLRELEEFPYSPPSFGTMLFAILFIAILGAGFVWLGGYRYARRLISGGKQARYRRLGEADLEQ